MIISSLETIKSVFELGVITTLALLSLHGLGSFIKEIFQLIIKKNLHLSYARSVTIGLLVVSSASYIFGALGKSVHSSFTIEFAFGLCGEAFYIYQMKFSKCILELKVLLILLAIPIWQYFPALWVMARAHGGIGMATTGNNDIANYTLTVANFMKDGFHNVGNAFSYNIGNFARASAYQTPLAVQSFISAGLNLRPVDSALPSIILASTLLGMNCKNLLEIVFRKVNPPLAYLIVGILLCGGMMDYIYVNYFLGQVIAAAISIFLVSEAISAGRAGNWNSEAKMATISGIALSVYAYPPLLMPFGLIFLLLSNYYFWLEHRKFNFRFFLISLVALIIGYAMASPYLIPSIKLLLAQGQVLAGWSIPPMNPIAIFILPEFIGGRFPIIVNVISWIMLFSYCLINLRRSAYRQLTEFKFLVTYISSIFCGYIVAVLVLGGGLSKYQNWKLLSFMVPLLVPLVLYSFVKTKKINIIGLSLILAITATSPIFEWSKGIPYRNYITGDMVDATRQIDEMKIRNLNVDVRPMFESIAFVSMLTSTQLYLNQPTYLATSKNPNFCTLIREDNVESYSKAVLMRLNSTYLLAATSGRSCLN